MQFCPHCGNKLDEEFTFCPHCGKQLVGKKEFPSTGSENEVLSTENKEELAPLKNGNFNEEIEVGDSDDANLVDDNGNRGVILDQDSTNETTIESKNKSLLNKLIQHSKKNIKKKIIISSSILIVFFSIYLVVSVIYKNSTSNYLLDMEYSLYQLADAINEQNNNLNSEDFMNIGMDGVSVKEELDLSFFKQGILNVDIHVSYGINEPDESDLLAFHEEVIELINNYYSSSESIVDAIVDIDTDAFMNGLDERIDLRYDYEKISEDLESLKEKYNSDFYYSLLMISLMLPVVISSIAFLYIIILLFGRILGRKKKIKNSNSL